MEARSLLLITRSGGASPNTLVPHPRDIKQVDLFVLGATTCHSQTTIMDFWPATERNNDTLTDILTYISQLSLDDIDTLQSRVQSNDPTLSDEELAMALFAEEAAGLLNVAKEHVGQSTRESRSIVEELEEMEAAARYDRIVALAISEGHPIPPRPLLPLRRAVSESDSDDSSGVLDFSTSDSE